MGTDFLDFLSLSFHFGYIVPAILLALLIALIAKRLQDKKEEQFEKREY